MSKSWLAGVCSAALLSWPLAVLGVDAAPTPGPAPFVNPTTDPKAGPEAPAEGPTSILPDRPGAINARPTTAPAGSELLGAVYENQAAGIALRPPARCKFLGRVDADHVAQWVDEENGWTLKLSRVALDAPRPLTTQKIGTGDVVGLLDITIDNLKHDIPGGKIVRQDLSVFGEGVARDKKNPYSQPNLAVVAMRYTLNGQRKLTQQALFQANTYLYYVLTLTSPGNPALGDNPPEDPRERLAVDTFSQMIDSVHLLDRVKIRHDQDERLYRTRSFFVNVNGSRLRAALVPEQWFRIIKDGKDIGYSYVIEQAAADIPRPPKHRPNDPSAGDSGELMTRPDVHAGDDILIGIRSRVILDGIRADKVKGPIQTDSESWLFVTADRSHEDWTRAVVFDDGLKTAKRHYTEEFGASGKHMVSNRDGVREGRTLSVQQISAQENLEPVNRDLPPWYLPQAVSHLLPRILSPREPKGYMFAIFTGDSREVMERYVDVDKADDVMLNGQRIHAIPIRDRVGLEGSVTTHFVSAVPDSKGRYVYLGSQNNETKVTVVATDAQSLQKIWSNANLSLPRGLDKPAAPGASATPTGPQRSAGDLPGATPSPAPTELPSRR